MDKFLIFSKNIINSDFSLFFFVIYDIMKWINDGIFRFSEENELCDYCLMGHIYEYGILFLSRRRRNGDSDENDRIW